MVKDIIKPTLVLILICAVVSALLAVTYNLTGVGELGTGISAAELAEYQPTVMPNATKLVHAQTSVEDDRLLGVYADEGGSGIAIHMIADGYGGKGSLKLLVGLDMNGAITGITVLESGETPGLGSKATLPDYLSKFVGLSGSVSVEKDGSGDVDAIAGATISSKAMATAVNNAFELFALVKGDLK